MLFEALLLLSGPPALALAGALPQTSRWYPALLVILLTIVRIVSDRWSWRRLGLQVLNKVGESACAHIAVTVFCALGFFLLNQLIQPEAQTLPLTLDIIALSLIISFVQELIFRTYLMDKMYKSGFSPVSIIFTSALSFAFIHAFFEQQMWILIGCTFFYGLLVSLLYWRYRNLLFISLSHFCLNLMVVHYMYV